MKKAELLVRLEIYKKEIYRRGYILMLAGLLPLIIVFIGMGLQLNIIEYGIMATVLYFLLFVLVMIGLVWWFALMVNKGIPKKIGLLCPKCHAPIVKNNVEDFMRTGKCGKCGEKIIEDIS